MTRTLSAIYDGEVFRPEIPLKLTPNKRYQIVVQEIPEEEEDAWDILESMVGKYDGPEDWSAEHNHYLYGTPKHKEEKSDYT